MNASCRQRFCDVRGTALNVAVCKDSVKSESGDCANLCPCVKTLELPVEVCVLFSKSPKQCSSEIFINMKK